jgi:hypothetical protein
MSPASQFDAPTSLPGILPLLPKLQTASRPMGSMMVSDLPFSSIKPSLRRRATPVRDMETVVELTYQHQATPWWMLQPDLQFIINPGGGIPDPRHPGSSSAIPDATVIGLRSSVKF